MIFRASIVVVVYGMTIACSDQLESIRKVSSDPNDEFITLVSAEPADPSDCDGSARRLGRAYSEDMLAIWDGTLDRRRVVIQAHYAESVAASVHIAALVAPLSVEPVPIEDLDGLYILPAYPTAWIRFSEISDTRPACEPGAWADAFVASIDDQVLERLAATEPPFGTSIESASATIHGIVGGSILGYYRWLEQHVPDRAPIVSY